MPEGLEGLSRTAVAACPLAHSVQLRLPVEAHGSAFDSALDAMREGFGSKANHTGVLLAGRTAFSPQLLAD